MSPLERGAAVISIDTELAWGEAHRRDGTSAGHRYETEREVVERILDLFTRYGVSATWAVVGHLFLDRCSRLDGLVHPEVVRPSYAWLDGDWYDIDPVTSLAEAPYFYGPDIVERIVTCPVRQEIGCHSFSHLMAGEPGCSGDAFESDLEACHAAASAAGVTLRSFVFPRNAVGHVELLSAHGYSCYRGAPGAPFAERSPTSRRLLRLADRVRPMSGSAVRPRREAGVWNLPQTFMFAPATRLRRLPIRLWARQPIARLRQAVRERSLFHLWFHPYNVTVDADRALRGLELVCAEAARLRDTGRLDFVPMGDLAALLGEDL
ncbi:MAG: polysaccharide deacetylase family protein [Jiangellaceae bacterium]